MIRTTFAALALLALAASGATAANVSFYQLPQGAYPHDVAVSSDGIVWYSGQRLGVLGRFDPKTEKAEHISLGNGSSPHGVIVAPDGALWLTDGGHNAMVRVDPKTRAVKLYPLPKEFPNANLNTAVFDKRGIVWFTGQNGVYGRVDPATGKVDAWVAPRGRGAYGITVTPSGDIWFCSLANNYLAKVDLVSGAVTEVVDPPRPGMGTRRVWSDSKGGLWTSFWHAGGIGRYDPAIKLWKVWVMPKSTSGTYSVYVDDKDRVWATDWLANTVQRFDPVSETFTGFPSDKKGSNIRQMLGIPGQAWAGESGTDRIMVVRD